MYAYREMFGFFNVGYGSAAAVIILIMANIVTMVLNRFIRGRKAMYVSKSRRRPSSLCWPWC